MNRLPDFAVIGAMKSGTSSMHYYLRQHPQIAMSAKKELNFFVEEINWRLGQQWYESHFSAADRRQLCGEASPNYAKWPHFGGVPERMHDLLPNAKLIYLVRDPVARIVSHYMHNVSRGRFNRDLTHYLEHSAGKHLMATSCYFTQIQRFLRYYRSDQVLIVQSEQLLSERRETLRRVFEFLGVDALFETPKFDMIRHASECKLRRRWAARLLARTLGNRCVKPLEKLVSKTRPIPWRDAIFSPFFSRIDRPVIGEEVREKLSARLQREVDQLADLTGQSLEDWSIRPTLTSTRAAA